MYDHERALVERLKDKPFALIGVNTDRKLETFKEAVEKNNLTWRSFYDGSRGPIAKQYSIRSYPTILVLDGEQKIRYEGVRGEKMDEAVDTLLAEMEEAQ